MRSQYLFLSIILSIFAVSCSWEGVFDISGLRKDVKIFEKNFAPGDPVQLQRFLNDNSFDAVTMPDKNIQFKTVPSGRWHLDKMKGIIEERISFPAAVVSGSGKNEAVFYLFRNGELRNSKVILWIPGRGMSDLAFKFIKNFIQSEVDHGFQVFLYIPPYHLERQTKGCSDGDGFFTSNTLDNLKNYLGSVKELRSALVFLGEQQVRSIGIWAGSMGASMAFSLMRYVKFDNLCIMIPIVDWRTVLVDSSEVASLIKKFEEKGFSKDLLEKAYGFISPMNSVVQVDPSRSILFSARFDRIGGSLPGISYCRSIGMTNIKVYERSHGTILGEARMYREYSMFLDALER